MNPLAVAIHALLAAGYTIADVRKKRVPCGNGGDAHLYATHHVSDGNGGTAHICPGCIIAFGKEVEKLGKSVRKA